MTEASRFRVETAMRLTRWGWMIYPVHDRYGGGSIEKYGEYSPVEAKLLTSLVAPGDTVVEGGAFFGTITLPLAQAVGAAGRVVAFEPQPVLAMLARANMALNEYVWAEIHTAGVGAEPGSVRVPILDYSQNANYGYTPLDMWEGRGEVVPIVTIDDAMQGQPVQMIKLDVEGMEAAALLGARYTIKRWRPLMFVENDKKGKGAEVVRAVKELEYTPLWVRTMAFSPNNFYQNPVDEFGGAGNFNMLCIPNERRKQMTFEGFAEAQEDDDNQATSDIIGDIDACV